MNLTKTETYIKKHYPKSWDMWSDYTDRLDIDLGTNQIQVQDFFKANGMDVFAFPEGYQISDLIFNSGDAYTCDYSRAISLSNSWVNAITKAFELLEKDAGPSKSTTTMNYKSIMKQYPLAWDEWAKHLNYRKEVKALYFNEMYAFFLTNRLEVVAGPDHFRVESHLPGFPDYYKHFDGAPGYLSSRSMAMTHAFSMLNGFLKNEGRGHSLRLGQNEPTPTKEVTKTWHSVPFVTPFPQEPCCAGNVNEFTLSKEDLDPSTYTNEDVIKDMEKIFCNMSNINLKLLHEIEGKDARIKDLEMAMKLKF